MENVSADAIFDRLVQPESLEAGWAKVYASAGGPGGDGVSVHAFAAHAGAEIARVASDLVHGLYRPGPLRRAMIPKRSGGTRPLAIPCVRDRVVQSALHLLLSPILEPEFEPGSYGYRPGRGVSVRTTACASIALERGRGEHGGNGAGPPVEAHDFHLL